MRMCIVQPRINFITCILAAKKANPAVLVVEIDQLVYQLYGLTDDEIRLVQSQQ